MHMIRWSINVLLMVLLVSCAGAIKKNVVVLPQIHTSSTEVLGESYGIASLPKSVAVLPFINRTESDAAFEVVRRTIFNHFASKNYRAPHWKDVDSRLKAASLYEAKALDAAAAATLATTLGVDGMLYGEITHYDKVYVGVYAQVAVGVRLRLVNRRGETVWQAEDVIRSHVGGISATPIGLILDAVLAAYHLQGNINLYRAADELGRNLMETMPEPAQLSGHQPPRITQVVHDGVGRILKYGDKLTVAMEGEPGRQAFVRIEGLTTLDMREEEAGIYTATYHVGAHDQIVEAGIVGVLVGDDGIQREWISPMGLLHIDNLPPAEPADLKMLSSDGEISLSWEVNDSDVSSFVIQVSAHKQGPYQLLATTYDTHWSESAENFSTHYYRVIAVDRAGNQSVPVTVFAEALPDSRMGSATLLANTLPTLIEGVVIMKAAQGIYHIRSRTTLADAAVLFVEPGVVIEMAEEANLKVSGALYIYGNRNHPVRIRGENGGYIRQPVELASEHHVLLRGLEIRRAGIALLITAGAPQLIQSVLIESQYSAMDISGVSRPRIEECTIRGSAASGVIISGKAQPYFRHNQFSDNLPFHIQNVSSYRIDARDNSWRPAASSSTVLGNVDFSKSRE